MNNHLRILTTCNYPSDSRSVHQVFVRALLHQMAMLGAEVTVVAPEPLWNAARSRSGFQLAPRLELRDGLPIHRPRYLTYSTITLPFGGMTRSLTVNAYVRAVQREAKRLTAPFDVCFAHFLYPQGLAAATIGAVLGIPAVVSLGESSFSRYDYAFSQGEIGQLLQRFVGVVANSEQLKDRCIQHYSLPEERIRVFPNGVNEQHFHPHDRRMARQKCGLPLDRPIVISVGQFVTRKGPQRVLEAIKGLPEIGAVFLGYGPQAPKGPQVLYQGVVPHEEVPLWLSAADVFVLPTIDEGCSNAILEALACGLPIVSSDRPFNHSIVDEQTAILVDPLDVSAIGHAIAALIGNPTRREAMGQAALERSRSFRLAARAELVLAFIEQLTSSGRWRELHGLKTQMVEDLGR
jgi:teichuronic acid biosynthesis glycosyltransferase TuaC